MRPDTESHVDAIRYGCVVGRWVCMRFPHQRGHEQWVPFREPESTIPPKDREYTLLHGPEAVCKCGCGGSLAGRPAQLKFVTNACRARHGRATYRSRQRKSVTGCRWCTLSLYGKCERHGGLTQRERKARSLRAFRERQKAREQA